MKHLLSAVFGTSHRCVYPFIPRKRHVVFDSPSDYQFLHIEPLVRQLAAENRVDVTVVVHRGWRKDLERPGIHYLQDLRPHLVRHYDLFISTEFFQAPWWLRDFGVKSAIIGHGVGPKVSYYATPHLSCYDAIFCPGPSIYAAQSRFARVDAKVYKTGLPITDALAQGGYQPHLARQFFAEDKPVILYAPTWTKDPSILPMDEAILEALATLPDFNVIIRPHPLFLKPTACGGKDWKGIFNEIASRRLIVHSGPGTSVYDVLPFTSALLSDMSSVMFEFLPLDRPILLYIDERTLQHYAADEFIPLIREATTSVPHPSRLPDLLRAAIDQREGLSAARCSLRSAFLYNIGSGTAHCVQAIYDMLGV